MKFQLLKVIIFIVVSISSVWETTAQDIHFSQIQKTPIYQNPAQTGIFEGNLRLNNIYRNQWYKIDYPYNSLQISIDSRLGLFNRVSGIGAIMLHDQSSSNYLTIDKFYLSFSHSFFYRNHQIAVGLQPGMVIKKYSNDNILFGSQFNPGSQTFDPSLPSNENNLNDRTNYFDLNTGVYWRAKINNYIPCAGFSVKHINMPTESFMSSGNTTKLPINYTFFASALIPMFTNYEIEPLLFYNSSTSAREVILGGDFYYNLPDANSSVNQLYLLSALRANPASNFDALVIGAGVKILSFDISLSYDFNISELREASNFQGAYEISIVYISNRKRAHNKPEPCYLL